MTEPEVSQGGHSFEKELGELEMRNTELKDNLAQKDHTMKKELLLQTELEFERKKCLEFENKWKEGIQTSDDMTALKSLCAELTTDINAKGHEVTELKKRDFEKKKRMGELEEDLKRLHQLELTNKTLLEEHKNLRSDIENIKETAVRALMDKDVVIGDLEDKLRDSSLGIDNNFSSELLQYKEKYIDLQEKYDRMVKDHQEVAYYHTTEVGELKERLEVMKARNEEKSAILEQDIADYEKYIEELKAEKSEQSMLTKSMNDLQDKFRRADKKVYDLETELEDLRAEKENEAKRLELEVQSLRTKFEGARLYESNFFTLEKESEKYKKTAEKEIEDLKLQVERLQEVSKESVSKILELEARKIRLNEDLEEYKRETSHTLAENEQLKQHFSDLKQKHAELENWSPQKNSTLTLQDELAISEQQPLTAKGSFSDLEDRIKELEEQLDVKVSENQQLRKKILSVSDGKISDLSKNMIVQLEDYRQHINKLENNILIIKLRYAEDESFWRERLKIDRVEYQDKLSKSIKEKADLYDKLEKLRKAKGDKKGVYVSALK